MVVMGAVAEFDGFGKRKAPKWGTTGFGGVGGRYLGF